MGERALGDRGHLNGLGQAFPPPHAPEPAPGRGHPPSLREFCLYFLRLGASGFGGPIALAGYMQRDLVERRRWVTAPDYLEGLALAQLAPGPLAAQLAIYLGWVRGRLLGALVWMQGAFYGIGAAVIAIIARSAVRLVRMTLRGKRLLWAIFAVNAAATAWTESEIIWVFVASGIVALVIMAPPCLGAWAAALGSGPAWFLSGLRGAAATSTIWKIAWYFTEAGAFVFGSGLAIVPFLYGGAVEEFRWLNERQFLDAVAVAMITPGPVVIVAAGLAGLMLHHVSGAALPLPR